MEGGEERGFMDKKMDKRIKGEKWMWENRWFMIGKGVKSQDQ